MALQLSFLTGVGSDVLVFAVLALLTVTLSNFMSNTATVSLILPVAVALLPGRELEMCLILGLCGSCALLLPVSTPPNAVAYSTGEIQTRDLRPGGLLIGLASAVLLLRTDRIAGISGILWSAVSGAAESGWRWMLTAYQSNPSYSLSGASG